MSKRLTVILPYPTSVNNLHQNAGRRRIKTPAYKAWLMEAQWLLHLAAKSGGIAGPFFVTISPTPPKLLRIRDIDAPIKATLDALKGIVTDDDSHCEGLHIEWCAAGEPGTVKVEIEQTWERIPCRKKSSDGLSAVKSSAPNSEDLPARERVRVPARGGSSRVVRLSVRGSLKG